MTEADRRPLAILGGTLGLALLAAYAAVMMLSHATLRTLQQPDGFQPSPRAVADIPASYLPIYLAAGKRYGVDWAILAGIGSVETDHGRSQAPGVRSGVNAYGCCAGPMQFNIRNGPPSTWDGYGEGGNVYDPRDAIPAAARMLKANGAPGDYHRAILAYNAAEWYVAKVMAKAVIYRGALAADDGGVASSIDAAALGRILGNPRITLTSGQRADLQAGGLDPRLLSIMAWIGERHSYIVTALRHDHAPGTNHEAGRAVDIGAVDGEVCTGTRSGACGRLAVRLAQIRGALHSTELIYCFDPDGDVSPDAFARADHCNHIHWGEDA